jgi:hypothetical protein
MRDPLGSIAPMRTAHANLIALIIAWLAACAPARVPKELLGVWGIGPLPPDVPATCATGSTEYRSDGTVLIRSGPQTVTAAYTTTAAGKGLLLERTNVQSNGEPNCQGRPAQYVIDHFVRKAYLEVGDDTLRCSRPPTRRRLSLCT